MGEYTNQSQQQYGQLNQNTSSSEEVVEFTATSPAIPQDVEFHPDHQLEEQIEDNLENESR